MIKSGQEIIPFIETLSGSVGVSIPLFHDRTTCDLGTGSGKPVPVPMRSRDGLQHSFFVDDEVTRLQNAGLPPSCSAYRKYEGRVRTCLTGYRVRFSDHALFASLPYNRNRIVRAGGGD